MVIHSKEKNCEKSGHRVELETKDQVKEGDIREKVIKEVDKNLNQKISYLVVGKSGVGKSSFLNKFTGATFENGVGQSITQTFNKHETNDMIVWDSKGFDQGMSDKEMKEFVLEHTRKERVDVLLVFIDSRLERYHRILMGIDEIPCKALLLCKCDESIEEKFKFRNQLNKMPEFKGRVFMTSGKPENIDPYFKCSKCKGTKIINPSLDVKQCHHCGHHWKLVKEHPDHENLVLYIQNNIGALRQNAFLKTVKICPQNVQGRIAASVAIITASMAASGASALIPVPLVGLVSLMGIEVMAIMSLALVWGRVLNKWDACNILWTMIKGASASSLAFSLGMGAKIVGSVIKFIPGVGTIVGTAIGVPTSLLLSAMVGIFTCIMFKKIYEDIGSLNSNENIEECAKKVVMENSDIVDKLKESKNKQELLKQIIQERVGPFSETYCNLDDYSGEDGCFGNTKVESEMEKVIPSNSTTTISNSPITESMAYDQYPKGKFNVIVCFDGRKRRMFLSTYQELISMCERKFNITKEEIKRILDQDNFEIDEESFAPTIRENSSIFIEI